MTNAAWSNRFTIKEGLTLGEKVFWPALLLNMFLSLLHRILDAAGWQVMTIFALNFAIAVLAVLPIRRATRFEFKRFRLVVRRPGIQQESRDLTYRESLKLSMLAAFGTVGIAILPFQWSTLSHNTHWSIELLGWLAIFFMATAGTGVFLLRNLYSAFSVHVICESHEGS